MPSSRPLAKWCNVLDLQVRKLWDRLKGNGEPFVHHGSPWYFSLLATLNRREVPGSTRLMGLVERLGLLNCLARHDLGGGVTFDVPLYRADNRFDEADLAVYETAFIECFGATLRRMPRPVTLLDCGADIGIFSARLVSRAGGALDRLIAFEPNAEAFAVLRSNIERLPVAGEARNAAVSNVSGFGELRSPSADPSDHARYFVPSEDGDVAVMRLDDLDLSGDGTIALKIDVEGGEQNVIEGARATIERARNLVVGFEAHPEVARRTGGDPIEIARFLARLKGPAEQWSFLVAEAPSVKLSLDRPFFAQVESARPSAYPGDPGVCNVICVHEAAAGSPAAVAG